MKRLHKKWERGDPEWKKTEADYRAQIVAAEQELRDMQAEVRDPRAEAELDDLRAQLQTMEQQRGLEPMDLKQLRKKWQADPARPTTVATAPLQTARTQREMQTATIDDAPRALQSLKTQYQLGTKAVAAQTDRLTQLQEQFDRGQQAIAQQKLTQAAAEAAHKLALEKETQEALAKYACDAVNSTLGCWHAK